MRHSVAEEDLEIRKTQPSDHPRIISVMENWWGGRDLTAMLPKLFLIHFADTSIIVEKDGKLIAFLVGFLSQTLKNEGYIHFVGVHPEFRNKGLGTFLYERFFEICRNENREIVRSCTSPLNKGSVEFHKRMGFELDPGDDVIEGIPVTGDYNRPGDHKVLFTKRI